MELTFKLYLPFIFILFYLPRNHAGYGGNDIFTSLEAMRRLWAEERVFVEKIEQVIRDMKTILPEMERYEFLFFRSKFFKNSQRILNLCVVFCVKTS